MSEQNRLQINWVTSAGGALGAVSSAVVLSSFGAAGTLVGAAVGSLCITVGGAVYSHYLALTKERVAAQALAARRGGRTRESVAAGTGAVAQPAGPEAAEDAPEPRDGAEEGRSTKQLLRGLPWKRIIGISAALFAVSMILIVAFELSTGRAVSSYTGGSDKGSVGTSVPGWSGTGQDSDAEGEEPAPGEAPAEDGVPQEDGSAPQEDGSVPQEEAPAEEDVPEEEAPAEEAPQEEAPEEEAPEAPAEEPVPEPAPAAPVS